MKMSLRSATLALAIGSFSATAAEIPADATPGELINLRLGWMKDVAGYKAQHHQPIEDLSQEHKVLEKALGDARQLGLDSRTVQPFIQAQMDVAKAVQYRYRADWLAVPEKEWQPRPLEVVRQQIGAYSDAILRSVSLRLKQGTPVSQREEAAFMQAIQQPHVTPQDKALLWRTFSAITLTRP